ncbi:MAG: thiamine pyrophosphate-binding protein [Actinobacteria bacterium]|nr:thiamine pyrophosphate-binding protein [Actinomycetota bacterium]
MTTSYSSPVGHSDSASTVAGEVLRLLKNAGVTTTFGIPGVHNLPLWNALDGDVPRIVSVRHEQSAVYAADGLARATGGIGVALTTTGPGAANALGAFGEAAISRSSVLVIASEAPIAHRTPGEYRGYLHEMEDQAALFAPLAKRLDDGRVLATSARSAREALTLVADALINLRAAPSGAAYVGIPSDILSQPAVDYEKPAIHISKKNFDIARARELISDSAKVVIWAGGGAIEFSDEIARLADHLSALVITSFAGRGVASESAGYVQLPIHEKEAADALRSADLLLIIGSQFDGMNTKNWKIDLPPKVIVIDAAPELHGRNIDVTLSLKTELSRDLFAEMMKVSKKTSWSDAKAISENARTRISSSKDGSLGMALVSAIDQSWPASGQILCDMCIAGYWFGGYSVATRPRRIAYPVGWGTLGFALPASIGSAGHMNPTLVICGDGGIAFALSELATIVQENLPITILLHDDGGYGMLRYDQEVMDHPKRGVDLVNPDWKLIAQSFGISFASTTIKELSGELTRAARSGKPEIILITESLNPPKTTSPRWREN